MAKKSKEQILKMENEVEILKTPKKSKKTQSDLMDGVTKADNQQKIDKLNTKIKEAKNDSFRSDPSTEEELMDSSLLKNPEEIETPATEESLSAQDKVDIVSQAIRELQFARRYKQGKIRNWQKNEEMYYGKKTAAEASRANVDLARMQEHVHTVMAQIDDPLIFNFGKRKDSQLKRVARLNALRIWDAQRNNWDLKDIVGKKQMVIYGRTAYVYYADSVGGIYQPHLENIDIYDLLVDPSGGGVDVEQMLYWGRYGVVMSKEQLEQQMETETDPYIKESLQALIDGSGNNTESTQEETNKWTRMYGQNTIGKKDLQTDEKYKFWQWFTTFKGTRYVLKLQATAGRAIDICPLNEKFESNLWPLWTYAAFMDLTEFWTPSYCDYVREIFMAQNTSINQMLDNAEAINKPQKVVNVNAIENLAELKYRRDGLIKTRGDFDANKAVQILATPSINTPILVFNTLESIQEKALGVSSGDKGAEDTRGKVAIYQGNQAATAGRYGLVNKSIAFGYNRFAELYQWGVREHLIKKVSIDIIGPDGIETEEIKRSDIFRKGDDFRVKVESSNADRNLTIDKMNLKIVFLDNQAKLEASNAVKIMNAKKAFEIKARVAGFDPEEIKQLMDVSEYADEELMSEAARDIESLVAGDKINPNQNANNAYKQRFVDYMKDHQEDMDGPTFKAMFDYVRLLTPIIYRNEAAALQKFKTDLANSQADAAANPTPPGPNGGPSNSTGPMLNNNNNAVQIQ